MNGNGKSTATKNRTETRFSSIGQKASLPFAKMVNVEQATDKAAEMVALIQRKQALREQQQVLQEKKQAMDLEKMFGTMSAMNTALPVVGAISGDPNTNLQNLANVVLERGCDIAESFVEITIDDES